jgi:hypothetical protein
LRARLLLLAALTATGCSSESGRVRDARDSFYSAISRFDHAALRSLVATEYLAVDRGRLLNLDSLIADVTLMEQDSLSVDYAFSDSTVQVDPPVAWLVYRARRIVSRGPFADTSFTIESAAFRRDGGGWRVFLVHRTELPGAGPTDTSAVAEGRAAPMAPAPASRPTGAAPPPAR